jgi:hypothetical protein
MLRLIQASSALADHEHSRSVSTTTLPLPPDAGISDGLLVIDVAHFVGVGPLTLVVAELPHPATATRRSVGQNFRRERMPESDIACAHVRVEPRVRARGAT